MEDVVQNAVLIESYPNTKPERLTVKMMHRFYVPIIHNGTPYTVRVVAEELVGSDGLVPVDAQIYDVILQKRDSAPAQVASPYGALTAAGDGINNITIREMLSGVKDSEGDLYVSLTQVEGNATTPTAWQNERFGKRATLRKLIIRILGASLAKRC